MIDLPHEVLRALLIMCLTMLSSWLASTLNDHECAVHVQRSYASALPRIGYLTGDRPRSFDLCQIFVAEVQRSYTGAEWMRLVIVCLWSFHVWHMC